MSDNKLQFKRYRSLEDIFKEMLREDAFGEELDRRHVYEAWASASGAGKYTLRHALVDGKLYITVNSSVVRSQLYFQRAAILKKINELLREDALYSGKITGGRYIKELILK